MYALQREKLMGIRDGFDVSKCDIYVNCSGARILNLLDVLLY